MRVAFPVFPREGEPPGEPLPRPAAAPFPLSLDGRGPGVRVAFPVFPREGEPPAPPDARARLSASPRYGLAALNTRLVNRFLPVVLISEGGPA